MGRAVIGTFIQPPCNDRGEGNGLRRVPMMDGSDHSRHALARRGSEMGEQGPQGRLEVCPIQLDTVQLNWTWFSSRGTAGVAYTSPGRDTR